MPVALRTFVDSTVATSWGAMFAMSVVSLVPVFLAFLIGQRYLVRGAPGTGARLVAVADVDIERSRVVG